MSLPSDQQSKVRNFIATDLDAISMPRYGASLKKFMDRFPDGAQNVTIIAKALCLGENEVEQIYAEALAIIKEAL